MSTSLLLEMLRRSGLEHFYPSFSTRGITQLDNLVQLSMQDYNSVGVTSMEDRRRLFQLIQTIKAEYPDISGVISTPSLSSAPSLSHSPTTFSSHAPSGAVNVLDGSGYGMTGVTRGFGSHSMSDTTAKQSDPRASVGRRSGTATANALNSSAMGHSRTMSNSMGSSAQQQLHQDDPTQQQLRHQQQMQQFHQQQYQQQYQQQSQIQYQQQQYHHHIQPQQTFDGRNFKEASEDEEDPIPVLESKQRGLDAYSVPTGMARAKALGRNASSSTASDMTAKIRVCVRKRPLNSKEINKGEKDMATVLGCQLAVDEPKVRVDMTKYIERHNFIFDDVFDSDATNEDVYRRTAYPLVQYLFEGGKATCFAYGQTGSGKTFTMLDDKQGLYVLAARDIFIMLRKPEHSHLSAYIGFYEIYQGHLYDLLNNRKRLNPREDGKSNVVISGLKEYEIVNVQGLMQVFEYGNNVRSTGSTNANADSSRSHAIMQIVLKNRANKSVEGKLSFIDLAGSERGADRGETDVKTRMEGAEINKSLLALKECIRALDQDKKHTPFRQSKLTQVLKDSFVGNSRTCMVATISPNNSNSEHTLNTLRYADRVKELKAESGAKGLIQEHDTNSAQEEYMDDVEGYGEELEANVYDDDYLSSEGENVADVTIDLLEDEEFPDLLLDQEEMSHHALATSSYDHELEDPTSRHSGQTELNQSHLQQQRFFQQQQPQSSEGERSRESISKSLRERERDAQQPQIVKTRKSEAFSRLPMPRSSQSSGSASGIPTLQHRHSQSSHSSRNNTNNTSPQLGNKSREVKSSPSDVVMSPGVPNDYVSQKGSGHTVSSGMASSSPNPIKHSPINTKLGYQSSMPSNNGPMSSITGNNDLNNYIMASPTSPKITAPSIVNGNGNADRDWTVAEMNDFLIEHRNQLRECGDLTKRETKLLANVTLGMSSPAHAQSTGYSVNKESFMKYISELDEIVDEKLITIVAMSHKLKALRGHT